MSNINFYGLSQYYNLAQGIEDLAPELLEDAETHYLVMQYKLAKKALERHVEDLEDKHCQGN